MIRSAFLLATLAMIPTCGGGRDPAPVAPKPDPGPAPTVVAPGAPAVPVTPPAPRAAYAPALIPTPIAGDPTKTTIHRLSNGMTVYLSPDPQEPSIVAHIAVRAGGGQDPANSTGLAHYLEHMLLFKGTSKLGTIDYAKEKPHLDKIAGLYAELRKPGVDRERVLGEIDAETQRAAAYAIPNEIDQIYQQIGVSNFDAYTGYDATVIFAEVPRNRFAQWARVEAERYSDPAFRLFWPELEVVYEEKNRGLDQPTRQVHEAYMRTMFPSWTSVLGEIEHLKTPAYQDMVAFYQRYYTPENMAILLSGDVDASVLPILEQAFGAFRRPAGEAAPKPAPPKLSGRTEVSVTVPEDGVLLGWPLVPAAHPDRLALEVMDLLLFDNGAGLLASDLLITQKVASATTTTNFLRDYGYYEVTADALAGQTHAEVEQLLLALVGKLSRGEFSDADLAAAVLGAEVRAQQVIESNQGRMDLISEAFIVGEDWRDVVTRIDRMKRLTRADIMRVAKQYLGASYLVVKKVQGQATPPKIARPKITPVKLEPGRRSAFAQAILDMPVIPTEPVALVEGKDYQRGTLPTGQLITVGNRRNGLFALAYTYDHGAADDRLACTALGMLAVSGTRTLSPDQVARRLRELGLSLEPACGKDETSITLSGVDRNLEAGVALLRELLADPVIAEAAVKARIATELTERANTVASPREIAHAQDQLARHGADSELLVVASNKQLQAATAARLKQQLAQLRSLKHRTAYFGPRAGPDLAAAITLGDGKVAPPPPRANRFRKPNAVFATAQDMAQTQLRLLWPRGPTNDGERALCTLADNYIGYVGKLLFQEVREARGLAYIVYGGCDSGTRKRDDASLFAYAGVQGDKAHDALDAMLAALRKPLDAARLERARDAVAQSYRVERVQPRAIASTVYAWEDQGDLTDPRAARVKRVLGLDKAALESWLKAAIARPFIVSITGDKKPLDDARLRKLAPLTWVPVAKLFGY